MKIPNELRYYAPPSVRLERKLSVDLCVFGGTSGGIIAAIVAKQNGLSVALVEPGLHLGGLSTGGLGFTDFGDKSAVGGISLEFYRRVGKKYGMDICWRFEPHVAEEVFREWMDEAGVECHMQSYLESVDMDGQRIKAIYTENGLCIEARQFMDASYEGDLMAKAGVPYTVGRESNETYGETYNGQQCLHKHQFNFDVDAYVTPGDPSSGLLPGVLDEPYELGAGDDCVQAYNFRLCLTDDPEKRIPFSEPEGYRREDYELLVRYCKAGYVPELYKFDHLINGKYDMNNQGAVSSDFIGMNHAYPEASYEEREEIFQAHVRWTLGLMWFWAQDPVVDDSFREPYLKFGWPKDEFQRTGGFAPALYIRESRRMLGDLVMTEHHCRCEAKIEDPIALASYVMDSHNCRRILVDGKVKNEGDVQMSLTRPYPISYRNVVPPRGSCENLTVPFCLSASHIAFGSIRMEPVFMIIAQSCAEAAKLAIEQDVTIQDVPYDVLSERLLAKDQFLDAYAPSV